VAAVADGIEGLAATAPKQAASTASRQLDQAQD